MHTVKDRFRHIGKKNKETILRFAADNRLDGLAEETIESHTTFLVKLGNFLGQIHFEDVTKDEMKKFFSQIDYASSSQETMKITLKKFYKWIYDLEKDDKYPDCVRWIKFKTQKQKQREKDIDAGKKKIISLDEYHLLQNAAGGFPQIQAILETLYWSGCRIGELVSMNVGDVEESDGCVIITLRKSKTMPRRVPITEPYPEYLMIWKDKTPFRNQLDKPLWINQNNDHRVLNKRLKRHAVQHRIRQLCKQSGINKRITPHCFRHTAISRDCNVGMPHTHLITKYGWVENTDSIKEYDHNDFDELLRWMRGDKPISPRPTYEIIKHQKERLEHDFEQRLQSMEQKFEEKMKTLDSRMARAARQYNVPSQQIIEDYNRLKKGIEVMLSRMVIDGRSKEEIEEIRKLMAAGLA